MALDVRTEVKRIMWMNLLLFRQQLKWGTSFLLFFFFTGKQSLPHAFLSILLSNSQCACAIAFSLKHLTCSVPLILLTLVESKEKLNIFASLLFFLNHMISLGSRQYFTVHSLHFPWRSVCFYKVVTQLWTSYLYADDSKQNCSCCAAQLCCRQLCYTGHNHQVFYETQALSCSGSKAICTQNVNPWCFAVWLTPRDEFLES